MCLALRSRLHLRPEHPLRMRRRLHDHHPVRMRHTALMSYLQARVQHATHNAQLLARFMRIYKTRETNAEAEYTHSFRTHYVVVCIYNICAMCRVYSARERACRSPADKSCRRTLARDAERDSRVRAPMLKLIQFVDQMRLCDRASLLFSPYTQYTHARSHNIAECHAMCHAIPTIRLMRATRVRIRCAENWRSSTLCNMDNMYSTLSAETKKKEHQKHTNTTHSLAGAGKSPSGRERTRARTENNTHKQLARQTARVRTHLCGLSCI